MLIPTIPSTLLINELQFQYDKNNINIFVQALIEYLVDWAKYLQCITQCNTIISHSSEVGKKIELTKEMQARTKSESMSVHVLCEQNNVSLNIVNRT